MWLPNRIFSAFRQQCLQKIAWIESFLNEHALLPDKVTPDKLEELNTRNEDLSNARRRMASEWARHLVEVQEWGLKKGQKEPSEELLHTIEETNRQVDDCLKLSEYKPPLEHPDGGLHSHEGRMCNYQRRHPGSDH